MSNSGRRVTHASGTGFPLRGSLSMSKMTNYSVCPICNQKIGPKDNDRIELFGEVYHLYELADANQLIKPDRKLIVSFEKKYKELAELGSKGCLNGEQQDYENLVKLFQMREHYGKLKKKNQAKSIRK